MKKFIREHLYPSSLSSVGESYKTIFQYFMPEYVIALILYSMPYLVDARWVASLGSTAAYASLGITNTWLHFIVKIIEGVSIGTVVLTGQANGSKNYETAGTTLINSFWTMVFMGAMISSLLFFGAHSFFYWYGVSDAVAAYGIPFLKLRSIGIFFTCVYFALIGFLKGIKKVRESMYIFVVGCTFFLFFDYVLIFGMWGFPAMGVQGSALATIIQYVSMCVATGIYIGFSQDLKKYAVKLFGVFTTKKQIKNLFLLSLPVMIDKAALSASYVWLGKCLAPMGTTTLAGFSALKEVERFMFLPAIALASVVTFLVSNAWAQEDWQGIKNTIKRVLIVASLMVFVLAFICCFYAENLLGVFDSRGDFSSWTAKALPILSVLIFLDLTQIILSASLRGLSDVKTVMWTRLLVCAGFFVPVSYFFSTLAISNTVLKFVLIYGSLYLADGIMTFIYVRRFYTDEWKIKK
ncbi:MATE family efflux transporter [bacterium]|nr:MATE family efflux transporter [bacterium]